MIITTNGATSRFKLKLLGSFLSAQWVYENRLILITAGVIDEHNNNKFNRVPARNGFLFVYERSEMGSSLHPLDTVIARYWSSIDYRYFHRWRWSHVPVSKNNGFSHHRYPDFITQLVIFFYMYYYHFNVLNELIGGGMSDIVWTNNSSGWSGKNRYQWEGITQCLLFLAYFGFTGSCRYGNELVSITSAEWPSFAVIGQSWGFDRNIIHSGSVVWAWYSFMPYCQHVKRICLKSIYGVSGMLPSTDKISPGW